MTDQTAILRINYAALSVPACTAAKGNSRQRFLCWLDDGSPVGPQSGLRSPAYDGARALIASGVSPDCLMTTRAASSACDSWPPASVASFARLTVWEGDDDPNAPMVALWSPLSARTIFEKQGNPVLPGVPVPADAKEAVKPTIDATSARLHTGPNPAPAPVLSDAAQPKLPRNSRAASAHRKDSNHG